MKELAAPISNSQTALKWAWENMIKKDDQTYKTSDLYSFLHRNRTRYWGWLKKNGYEIDVYASHL